MSRNTLTHLLVLAGAIALFIVAIDVDLEWLQGTTLRPYRTALKPADYEAFVSDFSQRLVDHYGDVADFLYTFKRILFWAHF